MKTPKTKKLLYYFPKEITKIFYIFENTAKSQFVTSQNRFYSVSFPNQNIQGHVTIGLPNESDINAAYIY